MTGNRALQRVSLEDVDRAIKAIENDGGVILTGFTSVEQLEQVGKDVEPFLRSNDDGANIYTSAKTGRCSRLWGRSKTVREEWGQHPCFVKLVNHFLETITPVTYLAPGDMSNNPILSYSGTIDIGPGGKEQIMHRDDIIWHQVHKHQDKYQVGSDVGISLLVPGSKTTVENGATWFIPGSHMWDHFVPADKGKAVRCEMEAGEALFFLSSALHAGGANMSDTSRPMHGLFYCRPWVRPEENIHVWFTADEVKTWSKAAQRQAGYLTDGRFLGHTDQEEPLNMFRANGRETVAV